jgi:hypothetical protein
VANFFDDAFGGAGSGLVALIGLIFVVLILGDGWEREKTEGENKEFGVHDVLLAVEIPGTILFYCRRGAELEDGGVILRAGARMRVLEVVS